MYICCNFFLIVIAFEAINYGFGKETYFFTSTKSNRIRLEFNLYKLKTANEKFNFDPANALFSGAVGGAVFAFLLCMNLFAIAPTLIFEFELEGLFLFLAIVIMGSAMGGIFGGTIALLFGHHLMNLLLPMKIWLRIIVILSVSLIIALSLFSIILLVGDVDLLEVIKEPIITKDITEGINMFFDMVFSIFVAIIYYSKRGSKVLLWLRK